MEANPQDAANRQLPGLLATGRDAQTVGFRAVGLGVLLDEALAALPEDERAAAKALFAKVAAGLGARG